MFRRVLLVILALFFAAAPFSVICAQAPSIKGISAVLMDADSGRVLFSKNPGQRLPPASLTKVMSLLLIMEAIDQKKISWTETVKVSAEASRIGGSQIWLKEKEEMTVRDLVKAVTIVSANDASAALAEHIYGSIGDFVSAMNKKAKELGLKNTHFENEHGLPDPKHYSSAYDIAVISRELIVKHPGILEFSSIWVDYLREGKSFLRNTNTLIREYPGADGLKTGHTNAAGFCLSATARKKNFRLISVIMGAATEKERVEETSKLLNYGFNSYDRVLVAAKGKEIREEIVVPGGAKERINPRIKKDFFVLVPKGQTDFIETEAVGEKNINLPVKKGQTIGWLVAKLKGKTIGRAVLISPEKIGRANIFVLGWRWIRNQILGLLHLRRM